MPNLDIIVSIIVSLAVTNAFISLLNFSNHIWKTDNRHQTKTRSLKLKKFGNSGSWKFNDGLMQVWLLYSITWSSVTIISVLIHGSVGLVHQWGEAEVETRRYHLALMFYLLEWCITWQARCSIQSLDGSDKWLNNDTWNLYLVCVCPIDTDHSKLCWHFHLQVSEFCLEQYFTTWQIKVMFDFTTLSLCLARGHIENVSLAITEPFLYVPFWNLIFSKYVE